MQRITISVSDGLGLALEDIRRERGYQSRSEAVRDLVRAGIEHWRSENVDGAICVANLSYVFDRRTRELTQRLAEMQHAHHDLVVTTNAIRLDHFHTMESVFLKGPTASVRAFADGVRSERGVRSGSVNLLLVDPNDEHEHASGHVHQDHSHLSPGL